MARKQDSSNGTFRPLDMKQAEKSFQFDQMSPARDVQARLASIVESSNDAIISKSLDGVIVSWNSGAERLFGYSAEEAIGNPITMIIPSDRRDEEVAILFKLSRGERIEHFETVRVTKCGRLIDISLTISPIRDHTGRVVGASKVARDISERKRTEGELQKQERRIRLLWEAASTLLMTEEPDAMMQALFAKIAPEMELDCYCNFVLEEGSRDLLLNSWSGISDEQASAIARVRSGEGHYDFLTQAQFTNSEIRSEQSQGRTAPFLNEFEIGAYVSSPLLANGQLLGTLVLASRSRDFFQPDEVEFLNTVCRYLTVAYERLRFVRELKEADRKKDDFIALLAHELRNPLAPIRSALEILKIGHALPSRESRAREIMGRQILHMVRLIDDLLDISRIGRNKMDLRKERVSLSEVVNAAVESAQPVIDSFLHELFIRLPDEPVVLNADMTRLAQVFSNLLTNSAKYTPKGGKIWLLVECGDGTVSISVRDNGIGIPQASLPTIFDMFSQVDRSIERSTGGLGIGLALVKGLTEMHGGSVRAESDERGSIFTVTLPTASRSMPLPRQSFRAVSENRNSLRVLVVDDNLDGAESLSQMLELLGNSVDVANDGIQAIERAAVFRPDLIFMDVGMPRLNGYEATRQIRTHPWSQQMLIVALTGWGQEDDRKRSEEAGCDGHLVKPVSLSDIEIKLSQAHSLRSEKSALYRATSGETL